MNPFTDVAFNYRSGLLGAMSRGLVGGIGRKKTITRSTRRAKSKKVKKWRMHNKMARMSRRINRIRMKGK